MDRPNLILHLVLILSLVPVVAHSEESTRRITFQKDQLRFTRQFGYDIVRYGDLGLSRDTAAPQVPEGVIHLALPPGKDIALVTVTRITSDTLAGIYDLYPVQPPQVLSNPVVRFSAQDRGVYSSAGPYPNEVARAAPHGYFSGYNLGSLIVYPVQYVPSKKLLIFHPEIELRITYRDAPREGLRFKGTRNSALLLEKAAGEMVANPSSLVQSSARWTESVSLLPDETHEYILITGDALVSSFQPLVDWKLKKGLSAKTVTTSWISAQYAGADEPEKIRNFIRDAHQTWGTLWVLLGGDVAVVPVRYAYAMDCQYGSPSDNNIPCDLYYSDLDGTWNANGNGIYGEIADSVDMYPDVFVGRASVETPVQAAAFVNKLLTYEKNPPGDYQTKALFLAMVLWGSPYTNSGLGKNYIDSLYVPPRFDPITKLYQDLGNESRATAIPAMNAGANLINHDGHAGTTVMGLGPDYLTSGDMDALTNGPRYSILYSIGCWPGAFDNDCIAEHFIRNPGGGGVAFIGNSRYGWGSPGNPLYGYSDRFDQQFFNKLFKDNIYHIGSTLAAEKAVFVPLAQQENVYRWCEYEINLLGEPEMPIWTDSPRTFSVLSPGVLPLGTALCPVEVTDSSGRGVSGALVCLMADSAVYTTGLTGSDGRVNLEISTSNPSKPLYLTVTGQNFLPYESTISLAATGPYVSITSYTTNGSAAGCVIPGDSVRMDLRVKNFGSDTAKGITVLLGSTGPKIALIDSTEPLHDLAPGESLLVESAFSFHADSCLSNGETVRLSATISDSLGNLWTHPVGLIGTAPVLGYFEHQLSDSLLGNGDGFAEPGETLSVRMMLANRGLAIAQNAWALLRSGDPGLSIMDSVVDFGTIAPGSKNPAAARIVVSPGCPVPSFPRIDMELICQGGYRQSDSFFVSIGTFGFLDDMENGGSLWTHSGALDQWHRSSRRHHSGAMSWYCGDEYLAQYGNNMADTLITSPVTIDQNARLSFWCWYTFPNYGTDGLYVETGDGSVWTTLDFIGSGGALGTLTTGNGWLEYTYDLSHYPRGSSVRLRFRFTSDGSDAAEGASIDDVRIYRNGTEILLAEASSVELRGGWNMVSLPRRTRDSLKSALFPTASSFAFGYDGSYGQQDTLRNGPAYWLKFPGDQTATIMGEVVYLDSISVRPGWNMIGSISLPVPARDITSIPGGLAVSQFWRYDGNYERADTIYPGQGYWVKAGASGKLILSGAGLFRNRVRIVASDEIPPRPPDETSGGTKPPPIYSVEQNYPNPFNPRTTIRYQLPKESRVTLTVYTVLGQVIQVLEDGIQGAGYRSAEWNASGCASGIYFYEIRAINTSDPADVYRAVRKMILLR